MKLSEEEKKQLLNECKFVASRSGGPGGQNVNKVSTKVELRFDLASTSIFSEAKKRILKFKLANRINTDNEMFLVSSVERSQWRNKEKVIEKFFNLIEEALTPVKKRIKTAPTKTSKLKRLEGKKQLSQKKEMRKRPEL